MYIGKNGETYGDLEESILACLLIEPKYIEKLKVEERHFKKFGYILTFFKEFYSQYKTLDITLMFSKVKDSSSMTLMDAITYLLNIFVIPTKFELYQSALLEKYVQDKREEWLRKKIYEKATKLLIGEISVEEFKKELNELCVRSKGILWR